MMVRRTTTGVSAVLVLLLSAAVGWSAPQDNAEAPECLKGIVAKVADNALYLQNTSFPDETIPKKDVMVLIDKDTAYFDGTKKVNRAALQPGNIVLVHCRMAGRDRKASLVRIIGGKKM